MSDTIVIEPAALLDLPALHSLIESAYRGDSARRGWTHEADLLGGQRTDPAMLEALLADERQHLLVARAQDDLIGCVSVTRLADDVGYLGLLTVDPARQAGGLGRRLIEAAEALASGWGAPRMEMTVIVQRADLIAWYERRGYARTGETRPFPLDDARFGLPQRRDLEFAVLARVLRGPIQPR